MPLVLPSQLLSEAFKEYDLIPSVIPSDFRPSIQLDIVFSGGKSFTAGEKLTKEETSEEPRVAFLDTDDLGSGESSTYTIVLADPDAPSRADPKFGQWRHWIQPGLKPTSVQALASIEGNAALEAQSSQASTLPFVTTDTHAATPYKGPGPPPGSGIHRYTFLLFREPKTGSYSVNAEEDLGGNEFTQRRNWNAIEFANKKGLTLVGATFFVVDG